jgi:hypothetical protein
LDAGGHWSGTRLGVRAVPYTLVVDQNGILRHAAQGISRSADLQRVVRRLVAGEQADTASRPERRLPDL